MIVDARPFFPIKFRSDESLRMEARRGVGVQGTVRSDKKDQQYQIRAGQECSFCTWLAKDIIIISARTRGWGI